MIYPNKPLYRVSTRPKKKIQNFYGQGDILYKGLFGQIIQTTTSTKVAIRLEKVFQQSSYPINILTNVCNKCHICKSFLLFYAAKSVEIKCETRQGLYTLQQMCSISEYFETNSSPYAEFHFYNPILPNDIFQAALGEQLNRQSLWKIKGYEQNPYGSNLGTALKVLG